MKPRRSIRSFGSKAPSKARQRIAVQDIAAVRTGPLSDSDKVSLSRSYGLTVSEIESIFAAAAERRTAR